MIIYLLLASMLVFSIAGLVFILFGKGPMVTRGRK